MGKKLHVNQDKMCAKCILQSHVALLMVGYRVYPELPSSQSKEKIQLKKLMVPVRFKNKSCLDDAQLSLCGLKSIVFIDSHKVSPPGL